LAIGSGWGQLAFDVVEAACGGQAGLNGQEGMPDHVAIGLGPFAGVGVIAGRIEADALML
jgi:hypothetical protein